MREITRDELGIKIWIDEEQLRLCSLHNLSDLIEVIENGACCDSDGKRSDGLHAKLVPSLIQHSQHGSNASFNVFGQSRVHLGDLRLKLDGSLDRIPSIYDCGCSTQPRKVFGLIISEGMPRRHRAQDVFHLCEQLGS